METSCGIQFYPGKFESTVPNVKLTRSKDGTNGVAYFDFDMPSFFEPNAEDVPEEAIVGMTMVDEEGTLVTSQVNARFQNGRPTALECQYVMTEAGAWDRFIRFMDRYAEANGLGLENANKPPPPPTAGPAKTQAI
uniref:Photosystem II reaction center Psb28 protein n=2 Tax=Octactis speculum TaxID=3111310 RepID=A0A7S2DTL7_9STRA|mmetsp:Transcript_53928/g.73692  ORF Transcript_53928/g.73692 Transcript_53928/m.73692 type:complete len:136 (+) Transcript_53928:88-495(+)|eukprot:CAMPEP_0185767332 /NCGR_PEP_ID=MMETSP1174-20130828/42236_1 /TAXON_ID=35687 /ORGANISM="Dictyocha speculum, Strain CCMP1381" /LENGTH=135 /DNA_ID=CAMNT_0028451451 /DNA_START=146 /DNA_END=553 /DNA_ORIENTATION=-